MRPNKLRDLLKSNKPTLSTHIHTTWPSVVEAIGHTGLYDYVEFVGEYGPFDMHDLDNLARAADIYNMSMQLKVDQEPRGFLAQRWTIRSGGRGPRGGRAVPEGANVDYPPRRCGRRIIRRSTGSSSSSTTSASSRSRCRSRTRRSGSAATAPARSGAW